MASLAVELDKIVGFLSKFWLNSLESGVSVSADVEDFSCSWVVDANFRLELSLQVAKQSVVKLVILGKLSLNLSAVVGSQEVLDVVELVGVRLVLQSVDRCLIQNNSLL